MFTNFLPRLFNAYREMFTLMQPNMWMVSKFFYILLVLDEYHYNYDHYVGKVLVV